LCRGLKFEPGFASGIGQCFDLAMVVKASAIEDNFFDLFRRSAFSDKLADFRGGRAIGGGFFDLEIRLGRVNGNKRGARDVVDDLSIDVASREVNAEARTLGGAFEFLAKAGVTEFAFFCSGHGLLDGFAFFAADLFSNETDAFAFIRLWRVERTDIGGALADQMVINAFDGDFGVVCDGHLHLFGN